MWLNVPNQKPPECDVRVAGFCAGIGMLDLAAELALSAHGFRAASAVCCEWEAVTAALLVGLGEATDRRAPVWDDLRSFDGRPWRGIVDCCVAGLPCPAFSSAGKRGGNADERAFGIDGDGPQAQFLRIVGEMRPALVMLENVGQWVTDGHFQRFGEQLCDLGYEIEDPLLVTAESVKAHHERERVFAMAIAGGGQWRELLARRRSRGGLGSGGQPPQRDGQPDGRDEELADAGGARREGTEWAGPRGDAGSPARRSTAQCRGELGDTESISKRKPEHAQCAEPRQDARRIDGGTGSQLGYAGDGQQDRIRRGEAVEKRREGRRSGNVQPSHLLPLFAPGRNDYRAWAAALRLDPTLAPAIESGDGFLVDGTPVSNADLLRVNGNSVVPLAAAVAFHQLLAGAIGRSVL